MTENQNTETNQLFEKVFNKIGNQLSLENIRLRTACYYIKQTYEYLDNDDGTTSIVVNFREKLSLETQNILLLYWKHLGFGIDISDTAYTIYW